MTTKGTKIILRYRDSLWNEAYNDVRSARAQHLDVTTGISQVLRSVVAEHTSDCSEIKQFDYRHSSWITQSPYFNFRSDFPKCGYFNIFLRSTYGSIDTFLLPVYYNRDISIWSFNILIILTLNQHQFMVPSLEPRAGLV